jgi:OOP family OmpA-OmpF porin
MPADDHRRRSVGLGSIGWGFGNGFRVEIVGNYRQNSIRCQ